jgi:hypothetical protein
MVDQNGLPRREFGVAVFTLILAAGLYLLLLDRPGNDFGVGAITLAIAGGIGVGLLMLLIENRKTGGIFPASLEIRLERFEDFKQLQMTKTIPIALFVLAVLALPQRFEELFLAFAIGVLGVLLVWVIVDRWVVLPRQLTEQREAS